MKAGEIVAGKYRLDVRLGIGGMGEVWKATHTGTGREFALKFMHAHAASSATARERFAREARVSAKINHPNVIDVFDIGEIDDGVPFLAMELLDGVSLADVLHAREPLTLPEFLAVMLETARALAAAHAVGVVHRDIKPGNIYLHRDRVSGYASAKILDFGISKLGGADEGNHTKTGAVLGSPRYMSPEQTRSATNVDARTDLWSAGVILFEGLTGTWPHEGDSFSSLVVAICTTQPASIDAMAPDLPESVRSIVRDCLQPLDRRIRSATDLEARLGAAIQDPGVAGRVLPRPQHPSSESSKSVSGLRIRPPMLGVPAAPPRISSPDDPRPSVAVPLVGLETQQTAPYRTDAAPMSAAQPMSMGAAGLMAEPLDEDGPTRIRELAPIDLQSMLAARPSASGPVSQAVPSAARAAPAGSPAVAAVPQASPPVSSPVPHFNPPSMAGGSAAALRQQAAPGPAQAPAAPFGPPPVSTPSPAVVMGAGDRPSGPVFKPSLKTVPLAAGAALHAELVRSGALQPAPAAPDPARAAEPAPPASMVRPALAEDAGTEQELPEAEPSDPAPEPAPPAAADPLLGTVSRTAFEVGAVTASEVGAAGVSEVGAPGPATPLPAAPGPPAPRTSATNKVLGALAAVLTVALIGIVIAIVSVLRAPPRPRASAAGSSAPATASAVAPAPPPPPSASTSAAPSASTSAAPTTSTSAAPTTSTSAAPSASTSAAPSASTSAAPASRGKGGSKAPPPRGSKVQQLGSGL